ncbi:hypothetical protein LCGC14_1194930 [marine sediment metagenome]|uniref:Transmembrane protein n=1 Tax=marine sediment metagenome TaxID=412755 RepID=A0A0F9M664_9ZZZZ
MIKTLSIPYLLRISIWDYTMWQIGFSIRILCFSFHIGSYVGLGWSCCPNLEKWQIYFPIHLKRILIIFTFGLDKVLFIGWKLTRLLKKMNPEGRRKFREKLKSLLNL